MPGCPREGSGRAARGALIGEPRELIGPRMLWGIVIEMAFFLVMPSSAEWLSYAMMLVGVVALSLLQRGAGPERAEA